MIRKEDVLDQITDIILYARTAKENYNNDDKSGAVAKLIGSKVIIESLLDELKSK